jgi:MIP family channel proteins
LIGTYLLVLGGTGTVLALLRANPDAPLDALTVGLAFGLAVVVAIYAFGHVSGAHINPAVTIALALVRRFPVSVVPIYVVAQLAGAILASLTAWALFGDAGRDAPALLGATAPGRGIADGTALLAEAVITFLLLVVIMATATDPRAQAPAVGLGIGLTVAVTILVALPISGGSLNPARSLGPMIVAGEFPAWLVYIAGPIGGGALGALTYDLILRYGRPPTVAGALKERPKL